MHHLHAVDEPDPQPERIRVLIADDHPLIIAGVRRALEGLDDIEVVGEAENGSQLMSLAERRAPSIVLMDLRMPGLLGVEGIERLHRQHPDVKIVVLSACDDRPTIDAALAAGASSYVLKRAHGVDIPAALRQASSGAVFHAPSVPAAGSGAGGSQVLDSEDTGLTDRERAILAAVTSGKTTAEISQELWVSAHTVKFHLTNIYRKLGVKNRAGAVRYALEHDLAAS